MTIEVRNVCKSFKEVEAVRNVNLQVESGEALALLGPNGAGKTTLVEMIEGVQIPDYGKIIILGKTWKNDEHFLRQKIGLALQETRFQERLGVEETLRLFSSFYQLKKERADEVLKIIQLENKRQTWVAQLSGGQRQRIAVARAILKNAPILILDEATSALDSEIEASIQTALHRAMQGKTVIAIAHRLSTISTMDRIIVLEDGKIVEEGTHDSLLSQDRLYSKFWKRQSGGFIGIQKNQTKHQK